MTPSLDKRIGSKVDVRHPVIARMCEFESYMMIRMEVATDGKNSAREGQGGRSGGRELGVRREGIVEASLLGGPWEC